MATSSAGRAWFLTGLALVLLSPAFYNFQVFALRQFVTPWYVAVLGTAGVLLMLMAVARRWTVLRLVLLAVCVVLVAFEWFFLVSLSRSPAYSGPGAGQAAPAFAAVRSDGTPFTSADLRGQATVLLFYRGHW